MVSLTFERGTIRLRQDGSNFVLLQVTEFAWTSTLHWNAEDLCALPAAKGSRSIKNAKKAGGRGRHFGFR